MPPDYTLRTVSPVDGPAIAALGEQTPDSGAVAFRSIYHQDPYATMLATHHGVSGVVAEYPSQEGIVGMGMMSTGECWYEDALRPFAYLFSIAVHPGYRRKGMATEIYAWLVRTARAELGEDTVVFASIQAGNEGSLRAAGKWYTQRVEGRAILRLARMRSQPPALQAGLDVRPAEKGDWEEIASKQNDFYQAYNFYPPRTAQSLHDWQRQVPFGSPIRAHYVVVDSNGNLLAGLSLTEEAQLVSSEVIRMPAPLRLANRLVKLMPADGRLRRLPVKDLWFAPSHPEAGAYLWEHLRWVWRQRGTTMMAFIDQASPLASVLRQPRWMPASSGNLVLRGPVPLREERMIYFHT